MHSYAQAAHSENITEAGVANDGELDIELSKEDDEEPPVSVEAGEDVELSFHGWGYFAFHDYGLGSVLIVVKNSAVKHVENVHENKGLENETIVFHAQSRLIKGSVS